MDSSTVLVVVDALVYVAYNLPHFSDSLIHQIRYQIDTSPGNELRGITKLTVQLLVLPDQSQNVRLEELVDEPNSGILKIIQDSQISDSQKSYQLIKLLTSASNKSNVVAQYLLGCSSKWQWCVNWLKKKMQEQSLLSHAATSSNEDSLSKNFQRTTSAQITLDHATAMFNSSQGSSSDMDVDSSHSDDVQTVPNVDQTVENQPTLDQ
ncbi:USP24 [Bugula neritina]|uniref:USP24 n=1 Tax=Bugula neritina TaxID=10212 RepID=A0A7J7J837_BUGNE|nr:USP24 [Bugula neritina]